MTYPPALWIALLVLAGLALLSYFLLLSPNGPLARSRRKAAQAIAATLARARPATATVIESECPNGDRPRPAQGRAVTRLVFSVRPAAGEPYETTAIWEVDRLSLPELHRGASVPVRIDADNAAVAYPDVPWAGYRWE